MQRLGRGRAVLRHIEVEPTIIGRITAALLDHVVGTVAGQYGNVCARTTIEAVIAEA
ncbi:hypothetical protein D3C78_1672940 [compost metagenome]